MLYNVVLVSSVNWPHVCIYPFFLGFPSHLGHHRALSRLQVVPVVKNVPANAEDSDLIPGLIKIPWRRKWKPTPVFLPGKFHGQRTWQAIVLGAAKSWM